MNVLAATAANTLWLGACLPEARRFQNGMAHVAEAQRRLLKSYLQANRDTQYGRRFGFARIPSVEAYQKSVPLSTYDDYANLIESAAAGQPRVLTAEPVQLFEPSSGSTAASKLIPYTASLKSEFRRGLSPWIFNLYGHMRNLMRGPAYWSITPLTEGRRTTSGGIPIGFEEDSAYLGRLANLVGSTFAVPNAVKDLRDVTTFRYVTLLFLLRQPALRLISVWNPTFLSLLLEPLSAWWERLLGDIARGTLTPPGEIESALSQALVRRMPPDPARARALAAMQPEDYQAIWPQLALISCWADGPSARYAQDLRRTAFPDVTLQGKGLLATEAFVSLPVVGAPGPVLAVTSHFFEFLPMGADGRADRDTPQSARQLEVGQPYAVVVTTGGGFYRYQLQDVVEVVGHWGQTPCLRFVGKTDRVSDWFGEKLEEQFVSRVLESVFEECRVSPSFAMLAPDEDAGKIRYTLYLELPAQSASAEGLLAALDRGLCQNFHYAYCRKLGQLHAPGLFRIAGGATAIYLRACQARGQRLGTIKASSLQKTTGWSELFSGLDVQER